MVDFEKFIECLKMWDRLSDANKEKVLGVASPEMVEVLSLFDKLREEYSCEAICKGQEMLYEQERKVDYAL